MGQTPGGSVYECVTFILFRALFIRGSRFHQAGYSDANSDSMTFPWSADFDPFISFGGYACGLLPDVSENQKSLQSKSSSRIGASNVVAKRPLPILTLLWAQNALCNLRALKSQS